MRRVADSFAEQMREHRRVLAAAEQHDRPRQFMTISEDVPIDRAAQDGVGLRDEYLDTSPAFIACESCDLQWGQMTKWVHVASTTHTSFAPAT